MRLERARGRGICRRSSMGKTKKTLKELEEEVCFLDSRRVFHRTEARHPPSLPLVAASEQQHLCALADPFPSRPFVRRDPRWNRRRTMRKQSC